MKCRISLCFLLVMVTLSFGQNRKSRADVLFYEYAYKDAIREYQKEQLKAPLSNSQTLNLAQSYFKIGSYKSASKLYVEVFKKDSTMSNYHFNKMLQAFSKNNEMERVNAFLATKGSSLPPEVMENASFNFELLGVATDTVSFEISNIRANSAQADFSPSFYKDKLLFSSGREATSKNIYRPSGESYLDIFVARITQDGNAANATIFKSIPATKFHQATPFYAEETGSFYYIVSNTEEGELAFNEEGKNALAIGMSDRFGNFQYLLKDLSTSFYYPFYESSTERLYFAANFEDSYGGTDLYYVNTNGGNIMSAPINLGPTINTPGNEIAPYIFENNLFFSSDVFYGLGGMDIYKSTIQGDTSFSIPVNLGEGINSQGDDFGFIIRAEKDSGFSGYFSSNRPGGKGNDDIYSFRGASTPGLKTLMLKGSVLAPGTRDGIDEVSVQLLDTDNTLIKEVLTDENGNYSIEVPWREDVTISVSKKEYASAAKSYDAVGLKQAMLTSLDFEIPFIKDLVEEKEGLPTIKLRKFYFTRGRSTITPEIALELDKVVYAVQQFPQLRLQIASHTDSRGGTSTNLRLSQRRANAIKNYLIQQGVADNVIVEAVGYGESKILNNCKNGVYCLEILHKKNERTLIVVLNSNGLF